MTTTEARVDRVAALAAVTWLDHQRGALLKAAVQAAPQRRCLYFKTGAGKTFTGLGMARLWGQDEVVVIAPPSTVPAWEEAGVRFGMKIECMSHAKFRMKDTKVSRHRMVIVDEFHLLGGHKGKGWKKLDTMARHLLAPLLVMSATPNYNDAERVYCIQHVLDPHSCKGGYLEFIYRHCETEANPFGMEPKVTGFRNFSDASEYLDSLPYVDYLPDDLVYSINDLIVTGSTPAAFDWFGYDERRHKMLASIIETKHQRIFYGLIDDLGYLRRHVYDLVLGLIHRQPGPVLVYANHSTVAEAFYKNLRVGGLRAGLVTGTTSSRRKAELIAGFNGGHCPVLVGTASLATGTDGMDKVCDTLIILDDTDDDSLRRQLIGRIMPRGENTDASGKHVYRIVLSS